MWDGATSKGDFLESLNCAGAWNIPLVFVINNNQWAISVPRSIQSGAEWLSDKAKGAGIEGITVDGNDLVAMYDVVLHALDKARKGKGATLIEAISYRLSDHTTADDASRYRTDDELQDAWRYEPIARLKQFLEAQEAWSDTDEERLQQRSKEVVEQAVQHYQALTPQPPESGFDYLYSQPDADLLRQRDTVINKALRMQAKQTRSEQAPHPESAQRKMSHKGASMNELTLLEAVNLALHHEMADNTDVIVMGEDVGDNGGVFRATVGLKEKFGCKRVIDSPLAEALIAGVAVGMASQGLRPVAEFQFQGFVFPAMEHIMCHAARMRNRTRGRLTCPAVFRAPFGGGIHAPEHHSESNEALFAHIPGLKVVIPSSPQRAYGLLLAAIRSDDPVMFFEPKRIYRTVKSTVIDNGEALPLDTCFTLRKGRDLTLVTWGACVVESLQAAATLSQQGIEAEVIDLATIKPLDMRTILASLEKTGRLLIVHEASQTCGVGAEILARVAENALCLLKAPPKRVTGMDTIMPYYRNEDYFMIQADDITQAARSLVEGWL